MGVFIVPAVLFGVLVCLFCVPIDLSFRFDTAASPRFHMQIGWLFNAVKFGLPAKGKSRNKTTQHLRKKKRPRARALLELVSRPLIFRFLDLIRRICRVIHLRHLRADIRAGLGAPADTGMLFGAFHSLFPFRGTPGIRVRWVPDFGGEPVLEGASECMARLRPIALVPAVLGFLLSKPVLRSLLGGFRLWKRTK